MSGGVTGTHVGGETGWIADENARDLAILQRGVFVDHGSTAGTARPSSSVPVKWFGTVAPTNAITNDEWYDRANEILKRYDGSAWQSAGSATFASKAGPNAFTGTQDFTGATVTGIAGGGGAVADAVKSRTLGKSLSLAKLRTVRVLPIGTSIESFDNGPARVICEQLKNVYGDAQETVHNAGIAGGVFTGPIGGMDKQPYGGLRLVRGKITATDYTATVNGNQVVVECSVEADSAARNVTIDGTIVGTTPAAGSQAYGVKTTFNLATDGQHTVTISGGGVGAVYLERIRGLIQGAVGIEILDDATLGGSALSQHVTLNGPLTGQVAGIAIGANVGLDALFGRTDVDIVVMGYTANDAGNGMTTFTNVYTPALARAVAQTKAAGSLLVLIVEMAGHYIHTGDSQYATFNAVKALQIATAQANNHVICVDWDSATRLDADTVTYHNRYYPSAVVTSETTGVTSSGDYIHPQTPGPEIGAALVANAFGLPAPTDRYVSALAWTRFLSSSIPVASTGRAIAVDGRTLRPANAAGTARVMMSSRKMVPYYADETVQERSGIYADILAAGTSDTYGPYLSLTGVVKTLAAPANTTDVYTAVMRVSGALQMTAQSTGSDILVNGRAVYKGGSAVTFFEQDLGPVPTWVTVSFAPNASGPSPWVLTTGKLYEFSVVRGTTPILAHPLDATGFSPDSVGGLLLWADAANQAGVTPGARAAAIGDRSGSGNDPAQATMSLRPRFIADAVGKASAFRFDGTDDYLDVPSLAAWTVFAVATTTAATPYAIQRGLLGETVDSDQSIRLNSGASTLRSPAGATVWVDGVSTLNFSPNTVHVVSVIFGAANTQAYRFGRGVAAGTTWAGDIAEMLIYDSALSTANRQAVEAYLAAKWL